MQRLLILFFLFATTIAIAQPVALPLTTNPVLQEYAKAHPDRAQLKAAPVVLTLPFMDDFSYEGPYPTTSLWVDNQVFVNGTLGMNPPSIGVATFDGLDADGLPYGDGEDWADTLTSQAIDLSMYNDDDNVVFSFFAQPQGLGDAPESIDRLILEFKNKDEEWQTVQEISGSAVDNFEYNTLPVGDVYLGTDFQFRFINYNARTGFVDLWHIDYVKIDKGRTEDSEVFEDVCFTKAPHSVLEEFTAMPWAHFQQDVLGETFFTIDMNIKNHSNNSFNLSGPFYTVDETLNNSNILMWDKGSTNANPNAETVVFDNSSLTTNNFNYSNLPGGITKAVIETKYYFNTSGQENISNQQNYNLSNDTVVTETVFANYFAYDDGTAEYNIGLDGVGSQAAVRFRPNIDDELKGIQIHIPYAADNVSQSQFITLKVWENDPTTGTPAAEPIRELINIIPQYGEGIGGFYTYPIDPPILLDGGIDYFIGWEQVSVADYGIPIGMDKNNEVASDNNYYNLGLGWQEFPDNLKGALMIRAVVSGESLVANEAVANASEMATIFPNPVSDQLSVDLKTGNYQDYTISIYTTTGQQLYNNILAPFVDVKYLQNGIYFIQIKNNHTDEIYYHKFIKQ